MVNYFTIPIFALALSWTIHFSACDIDPVTKKSIDDLIKNEVFTKGKGAAMGLTIVNGGQVLYANGYGLMNIESSIPTESGSLFYIGSVSKVIHNHRQTM
jgi:CubicO group peptidase (beta-lactamase class C family)